MKTTFIALSALCLCVLGVGCSKKNPPKPEKPEALGETVKRGFVMPVKPELPAALRSEPNVPSGMTEAQRRAMENESWWKERQRLKALHADAMQRYESEMAEIKRKVEEWQRERERVKRNYELAMEEWYNSLVVCLHCDSDLKTKGAKVCAECGRNQRDGGKSLITDPIVEKAAKAKAGAWVSDPNDPNNVKIEAAIREVANWQSPSSFKSTRKLTKADLEKLRWLGTYLQGKQLTSVKGLEKLTQLNRLYLERNKLTNLKGLEKLDQLLWLELHNNQLTDVTGLGKLTKLTHLTLYNNQLTDVSGLEKLTKLKWLNLDNNKLTNVTGLEKLTQLKKLELEKNQLTELPKGLGKLTQLTTLELQNNQLTSVKGLENLTQLTELRLYSNRLTDVKGLEKLTQLTSLFLGRNQLTDVKSLEKLTQLKILFLGENQLTDVKGLEKLTQLTYLNLKTNPNLTKAQIDELQKALPKCEIDSNPTK